MSRPAQILFILALDAVLACYVTIMFRRGDFTAAPAKPEPARSTAIINGRVYDFTPTMDGFVP
jgi:hypothetical protein